MRGGRSSRRRIRSSSEGRAARGRRELLSLTRIECIALVRNTISNSVGRESYRCGSQVGGTVLNSGGVASILESHSPALSPSRVFSVPGPNNEKMPKMCVHCFSSTSQGEGSCENGRLRAKVSMNESAQVAGERLQPRKLTSRERRDVA